jgi:hormone-sensitive lipase
MIESPAMKKLMAMGFPKIKVNVKIYIEPVVTPITIQYINS